MAFTLKDGQGTLHRNDKGGVETRPDYRGDLMLGGTLYELAGWLKDGNSGKWMSLSVKPKRSPEQATIERSSEPVRSLRPAIDDAGVDTDIPF